MDVKLGQIWEETRGFVTREVALLMPVGFATFGLAAILLGLVAPVQTAEAAVQPGMWMLGLIPVLILMIAGYIAISRMALRPGLSVGEALGDTWKILPRTIAAAAVVMAIAAVILMVAGIVTGLLSVMFGLDARSALSLTVFASLPPLIWLSIRMLLLWPVMADRGGSVRQMIVFAIQLTKGRGAQILLLLALNFAAYLILSTVLQISAGSIILLGARALGAPATGSMLISVLMAGFNAAFLTVWTVFLARYYRQAAQSSKGI